MLIRYPLDRRAAEKPIRATVVVTYDQPASEFLRVAFHPDWES